MDTLQTLTQEDRDHKMDGYAKAVLELLKGEENTSAKLRYVSAMSKTSFETIFCHNELLEALSSLKTTTDKEAEIKKQLLEKVAA